MLKLFKECVKVKKVFDEFVLRLANTKDVKKVYSGSEEIFGDEDIIEPKEINKIFKKLKNAEITAEDYSEKSPLYYMVVFNNGEIVKFKIFDNQYVQFNDLTSSFTIK